LKNQEIAISQQRFGQLLLLRTLIPIDPHNPVGHLKYQIFKNPIWQLAVI